MLKLQTLFDTPTKARMTAEEYVDSPLSRNKSDLIEGVFIMASPASRVHEMLVTFLLTTLSNFVETKQLGVVLSSNAAYRLSKDNVYQPDVSFVSKERLHLAQDVIFAGPPDLAVEVVSPSSRQYDLVEKKVNYGRYGVGEYWVIDPLDESVTFYTPIAGQLLPLPAKEEIVRSQLLNGYWLQRSWLFPPAGSERPTVLEVARRQGLFT